MASVCNDANGRRRILFVGSDGKRKAVRLGKASAKQADAFKVRIEQLVSASIMGTGIDDETSRWVADLDDAMHGKLAAVGLVKPRARTAMTLQAFLLEYFASLSVKPVSATSYDHTRRYLFAHFGADHAVRDISPADAEKWKQSLQAAGLSPSTVARRVGVARSRFRKAVRWGLIAENPFTDVRGGGQVNKTRMYFVTREETDAVLAKCPDAQWRLLVALSRYGGLRCPSEHLALKWGDIDWERSRIRVPSCKTEHYAGGDCRYIPMFPELRGPLMECFDAAEPGTEHVITRYRDPAQNLRTQFTKIIRRAGLTVWPRLWQNLRSSRQTELAERYPMHVVCAWIGNSEAVARDHYLQVRDEHFADAVRGGEQAAQNAAQQAAETRGNERKDESDELPETLGVPSLTATCSAVHNSMADLPRHELPGHEH